MPGKAVDELAAAAGGGEGKHFYVDPSLAVITRIIRIQDSG